MSQNMDKFNSAKYWVGCNSESAKHIYFSLEEVLKYADLHAYIAAFDADGKWIDEAQIIVIADQLGIDLEIELAVGDL